MKKIHNVEDYVEMHSHYAEALKMLRNIIQTTALEETIKWSMPTYCLDGKNVLGIGAFKNYFCLWFHNGVFLKDEHGLLINAQENKTKALRQMRFEAKADINEAIVLTYVKEAIKNQRLGREIKPKRSTKKINIPAELESTFRTNPKLHNSFKSLTLGKQRDYCNYITEAKRDTTKQSRIEKITPMILQGVGLHDKYKKC